MLIGSSMEVTTAVLQDAIVVGTFPADAILTVFYKYLDWEFFLKS